MRWQFKFTLTLFKGGTSTPYFSLRDELLNTERHHSDWSSSIKLRHMAVSFVSAGYSQPLEEVKTDRAALDTTPSRTTASDAYGKEQERNEGAMAQLQIRTPPPSSPVADDLDVNMDDQEASPGGPTAAGEKESQALFVIDPVGDQALKPVGMIQGSVPIPTAPSPPSDSEDEVILFRGRKIGRAHV